MSQGAGPYIGCDLTSRKRDRQVTILGVTSRRSIMPGRSHVTDLVPPAPAQIVTQLSQEVIDKSQRNRYSEAMDNPLILSIFPGIDLLGRGFEAEGFCVVRGPDILWGGTILSFHPTPGKFAGIIGGSPCQDFSKKRRDPPSGNGLRMLGEYKRVVMEALPDWFLLENVPQVPDIEIPGYSIQRFDLNANECGLPQNRLRHFQYGSRHGLVITPERLPRFRNCQPTCLATEGKLKDRRDWGDFCQLQGLPRDFDLPGLSIAQKYSAVGNGVPIPMGQAIARAIRAARLERSKVRLCLCGCGRLLSGHQRAATAACRKRLERSRKGLERVRM